MNYPELYEKSSELQCRDSKEIINNFANKIQWRKDGRDKLLDVGCGTGSLLMKYIYPLLPASFEAILGIDISANMIKFAQESFKDYKNSSFQILDIATKELPNELCEQFDHVTSFYCLHWVHDQKTALANIYKLLRNEDGGGGDCLFCFVITDPVYDIYVILRKTAKWASYMTDLDNYLSPLYYSKDPAADYSRWLKAAGFINSKVEVRNNTFTYESSQHFRDFVKAICVFMARLSTELQEEFLNDFINIAENAGLHKLITDLVDGKIISHYKILAVYAQKSNVIND